MAVYLNEILNLSKDEYADWTICLNNANAEQVYSFDDNYERLLDIFLGKNTLILQQVSVTFLQSTVCNLYG